MPSSPSWNPSHDRHRSHRAPGVMKLAALVLAAFALDLATFALIVPLVGIGAESIPTMASAFLAYGIAGVAVVKAAAALAEVLILRRVVRPRMRRLAGVVAVGIPVIGVAGNLAALVRWAA